MEEETRKNNFKEKKFVRILKIITESAPFALLLSIILFGAEELISMKESKDLTKNLMTIQSSLSTRYLGEFPNFLRAITDLYSEVEQGDSIVVMEDVLYYGIHSDPEQFYESSKKLLDLAADGTPVMIAYYAPNSLAFNMMVNEWLLSPEYYKQYRDTLELFHKRSMLFKTKKKALIDSCFAINKTKEETDELIGLLMEDCFGDIFEPQDMAKQKERSSKMQQEEGTARDDNEMARNILQERYFIKTRDADRAAFERKIENFRQSVAVFIKSSGTAARTQVEVQQMCSKLDEVRVKYLGKDTPLDSISYADIKNMYIDMSLVMEETYQRYPSITLIPVREFLSVRSWLVCSDKNGSKAIMAFPSRYDSSEIGFYSTDETTKEYVLTMRQGILTNYGQ
jgi:hypothetical protein